MFVEYVSHVFHYAFQCVSMRFNVRQWPPMVLIVFTIVFNDFLFSLFSHPAALPSGNQGATKYLCKSPSGVLPDVLLDPSGSSGRKCINRIKCTTPNRLKRSFFNGTYGYRVVDKKTGRRPFSQGRPPLLRNDP